MKDYEPRLCIICGVEYIPRRSDQRTCASEECKKTRQRLNYLEYREKNYAAVLENNRRSMKKRREEQRQAERRKDNIIAIGYADRQREATLRLVGKINTEL